MQVYYIINYIVVSVCNYVYIRIQGAFSPHLLQ